MILTADKDFGQMAARHVLPADVGVVLLRLSPAPPAVWCSRVLSALSTRADWRGVLAMVEDDRLRVRPLRPASEKP